ncbi:proliferating cell nuclear antigen (pcna) [Sulfolobus acidocaldarius]|nr:proliferating cell nuclear antigen (pcna) [Sulfolobus acidocaldarius]AAY80192.1 DNA polymerase sliding clamp A [Sulfolobus acidocaldarius DSM 639]AGE70772.1 DNA polymerase sliding clamp [Sulfolobus acidocaldarius N8]AGE73043.1 DNA polymerase sliding clamp [Sulfolobus acidocaldarius Ron12/I]ALU31627.1 DNA polymerase [Sulfolobus acidocaldarius]WCM34743.1 proliferating cell nuclear antigen (pcna) [Sulfolobus acidocaldarius DSM 639]
MIKNKVMSDKLLIMRIVYDDVRDLKNIVETLTKFIDEGLFEIGQDGIRLVAVDKAHVSLINIELYKELFKEYEVEDEFKFGFNSQYLAKILSIAKRKEEISIESDSPERVKITLGGALNRVFIINNIQVSPPEVPEVNLEFEVKASLSSKAFKTTINEISAVTDTVDIIAVEDKVILKGEGKEGSQIENEFSKDTGAISDMEFKNEAKSPYDVNYLSDILSLTNLSDYTRLAFSTEKPLELEFNMEGGGKVTYLLAPKLS